MQWVVVVIAEDPSAPVEAFGPYESEQVAQEALQEWRLIYQENDEFTVVRLRT
jgi:hypothetical protein